LTRSTPPGGDAESDVLICGLGPVGQLLALLLTRSGVSVAGFDAAPEPYDLPRAAVIDDEVLRIFQGAGIDAEIIAASQVQDDVSFVTAGGSALSLFRPPPSALGHPSLVSIHQPTLERTMVDALAGTDADLEWGVRVERLEQHDDRVVAEVRDSGGATRRVTARWLVAADGGRSTIRDLLGIEFGGSTFVQRWLVVDTTVDRPLAAAPHPHFVGDPERPIVCLPMSPGRHRWEWMIHPGEDAEQFLEPDRIRELMAPWVGDESPQIERAVVYTFHSRTAQRWRDGRVLLAGDAAHLMPPFAGQGFSSGARDAANLAWKLDAVLHGAPEHLIDSYEAERRPHVSAMQRLAVRLGRVVQTSRPAVARARDFVLGGLDRTGISKLVQERMKPLPTFADGAFGSRPRRLAPLRSVGSLFPQPNVVMAGRTMRLDDAVGDGWVLLLREAGAGGPLEGEPVSSLVVGVDLDDRDGAIAEWLDRHDADWVLLRPDRFVFALGRAEDAREAVTGLRRLVGRGVR